MYIVADSEEGILCVTESHDQALAEYEKQKMRVETNCEGYLNADDRVVMANIERHFFAGEMETTDDAESRDNEGQRYWEWKETIEEERWKRYSGFLRSVIRSGESLADDYDIHQFETYMNSISKSNGE